LPKLSAWQRCLLFFVFCRSLLLLPLLLPLYNCCAQVLLAHDAKNKQRFAVKAQAKAMVASQDAVPIILTERRILTLPNRCPFIPHLFSCFQTETHLMYAIPQR